MKGLLIKDYSLLKAQKNLLLIIPLGLLFLFTNDTPVMGISYTLYVITFLSTSLIAYDSFDNGMAFLMTLPGGRQKYVTSKYLFSIINSTVTALSLVLLASILQWTRGHGIMAIKELLAGTFLLYAVALIFSALMLPLQLKFGHEKSRIVLMIFFGILFLFSMAFDRITEALGIGPAALIQQLEQSVTIGMLLFIALLLMLFVLGISWMISQKIMKNKNF